MCNTRIDYFERLMASTQFYSPLTGIQVAAAVRGALARSGARITVCRLLPLVVHQSAT